MKQEVIDWLLQGPPWVRYRAFLDLLDEKESSPQVVTARQAMLADHAVQGLLSELAEWPGTPVKRHNDAALLLHKLVFLADLGVRKDDPGVDRLIDRILKNRSGEGMFQVSAAISQHYGGTGENQLVWMLCDSPSILYALLQLGLQDAESVQIASRYLAGLSFDRGWPCTVAPELGKFRGPGRKDDPCPYATLLSLKALSRMPEWRDSSVCQNGAEALLGLWEKQKEKKPYLFAMGTDFKKLKLPMIWYDVVHVADVLSLFPRLYSDVRFNEMVNTISAKADKNGLFTAEAVWKAWSAWEFGQKKAPSYLLTLQVYRILKRTGNRISV